MRPRSTRFRLAAPALIIVTTAAALQQLYPPMPEGDPPPVVVPQAEASSEAEMRPYVEPIPGVGELEMVPVPGGSSVMGSPPDQPGRRDDEVPQRTVHVAPFWMSRIEIPWDLYRVFMLDLDRRDEARAPAPQDAWADAVSRPTPPYVPMDFGMGVEGFPAVGMTQLAARQFTKWLSLKTGRFYRLPSEAEWEHACRAGTTTAYPFGDDPAELAEHAWFAGNAGDAYRAVGTRAPNPWGLHDLHGNVAEWTLDQYVSPYPELAPGADAIVWPDTLDPRVVRGGSFRDQPEELRCAARRASHPAWQRRDPQLPKSIWYLTDAPFVGLRVVRPLAAPSEEVRERAWEPDVESVRRILERQRR